jgi:hypothetical protein
VLYGFCGLAAAFSLLQGVVHSYSIALVVLFGLFVLLGVQYLGYAEFDLAGRLLFSGEFQRSVSAQMDLRRFRDALAAAGTPADCWEVIREACAKFGFQQVRLSLPGEIFEYSAEDSGAPGWTVRVPLANGDYAVLERPFASAVQPMAVAPFVDSVRDILVEKFPEIAPQEGYARVAVSFASQ